MITLVIFQLTTCSSYNNEINQPKSTNTFYYDEYKLKGNVKYLEITTYNNDKLIDFESLKFNRRKEATEIIIYGSGIEIREVYSYDESKTNIKSERYEDNDLVESKTETEIDSIDKQGNLVQKQFFNNNELVSTIYNRYNFNDDLIETKSIDWKNQEKTIVKYNKKGNPLVKEMFLDYDKLEHREIFRYNDKNHLIESIRYLSDTNFYWQSLINYDSIGIKIDSTCHFYWSSNLDEEKISIHNEEIHTFDDNENLVTQIFTRRGVITRKVNMKYSKENVLQEKIEIHPNKQIIKTIYNKYGNIKFEQFYDTDKNLIEEKEYKIKRDSYENITKITFLKNGKIQKVQKRKYQYY